MDIKDLNKPQLILLAILLSFVTSIATGITTVTLMQQAPSSVTVPINRVIKQTVEKIQQVEGKTTVQTVVVKEEDLVVDAIAKNKSAIFTIAKSEAGLDTPTAELSAGHGFMVTKDGVIVADAVLAGENTTYAVQNTSGKFKAQFLYADPLGFSFLRVTDPLNSESKLDSTPPVFGDLTKMKAGQKVIVLGNIISSFIFDGDSNINITLNKSNAGGLVLNLDGEALGVTLFNEITPFISIDKITNSLSSNTGKL